MDVQRHESGDAKKPGDAKKSGADAKGKASADVKADAGKGGGQETKNKTAAATKPTISRPRAAGATAKGVPTAVHPNLCCCPTCVVPAVMEDGGKAEGGSGGGSPMSCGHQQAAMAMGERNEFGLITGEVSSDATPHAFVAGGKEGSAAIHWSGGNGGLGLQNVGSTTLTAPAFDGAEPAAAGEQATAWVRPGTGAAAVRRSYRGAPAGNQGNGYYLTARSSSRVDTHEELHVAQSRVAHDAKIAPLEVRLAQHNEQAKAKKAGATKAEAIAALQTFVDWNASIQAFAAQDTAQNTPGGAVDTADLASGTYMQDRGAKKIGGVDYTHLIAVPGEPDPAP